MAELSAGILSLTGKEELTIGEDIYTGKTYSSLSAAAAGESVIAVDGGTYSDGVRTVKSNVTIIGATGATGLPLAVISGCSSSSSGAALYLAGTNTVKNLIFTGNKFGETTEGGVGGAAIFASGSTLLEGLTFSSNISTNYGGALFSNSGYTVVKNSLFNNNSARVGGAVCITGGTMIFSGSTFSGNRDSSNRSIYASATIIVNDNTLFDGNIGTAIYMNTGSLTVDGAVFKNNIGGTLGSAIYITAGAKGGHSIRWNC